MSDKWNVVDVVEQEGTYDGKWKLTIDHYLLMKIINHGAAEDAEEVSEMENPKRLAVRVIIETKELPPQEHNNE